jgi:hypothetical protein
VTKADSRRRHAQPARHHQPSLRQISTRPSRHTPAFDRNAAVVIPREWTPHGGRRVEAETIGRITLPRPGEVGQVDEAFERRYAELEAFLAADEIEYTVIWLLQGLVGSSFPLRLDPGLELDVMSDRELEFALNAGAIWTVFYR